MCRLINICANVESTWNFIQECEKQMFTYVFPIFSETYYLLVTIILRLMAPITSSNPTDPNIFTQQSQHLPEKPKFSHQSLCS